MAFGDSLLKGADDVDTCVAEPLPGSLVTQLEPAHVDRQCRAADRMKSSRSAATSQLRPWPGYQASLSLVYMFRTILALRGFSEVIHVKLLTSSLA